MRTTNGQHYPWVRSWAWLHQATCNCGWEGEETPVEREADAEMRRHRREHYQPTWDDVCWGLGIGRYAQ